MKAQTKALLFIISFCVCFFSCEYSNDDIYYVDIKQKSDTIDLDINLANVNPKDTIIIYRSTKLYYKIDSKGKKILKNTITIDAEFEQQEDYIIIHPPKYDNSIHKLNVDIELKSHTGSISDLLGYEKYIGKYEYYVKFVKLEESFDVNLREEISADGFLTLKWEKPVLDNADIQKYSLSFWNDVKGVNEQIEITDPNITSFTDRDYVWGHRTYSLYVQYKNKDIDYVNSGAFFLTPKYKELEDPTFKYEILDNESMRVSWDITNYKCKYLIIDANGTQTKLTGEQKSIVMQRFRFPSDGNRFRFILLPYDLLYEEYTKGIEIGVDTWYAQTQMNPPLVWNRNRGEYYSCDNFGKFSVYSNNFGLKGSYTLPDADGFGGKIIALNEKTSQLAIYKKLSMFNLYNVYIYNYRNGKYENPLLLKDKVVQSNMYLSDNNRIYFRELNFNDDVTELINKCYVYNSINGSFIYSLELMDRDSEISVSSDGKYMCDVYKGHLKIYELEDSSAKLIYEYTNNSYRYSLYTFSPINVHELFLGGDNNFTILDVTSLTQKVSIKGSFVSQDPITGNMVILDKDYSSNFIANIYNKDASMIIGRLPLNKMDGSWALFNNRLVYSYFGTSYIDITNYIKK